MLTISCVTNHLPYPVALNAVKSLQSDDLIEPQQAYQSTCHGACFTSVLEVLRREGRSSGRQALVLLAYVALNAVKSL